MKKKEIIKDNEWNGSIFEEMEKNKSITITHWEHDFEKRIITITYTENEL